MGRKTNDRCDAVAIIVVPFNDLEDYTMRDEKI